MRRCCCMVDMERQFSFYTAHHRNPANVLLHHLTVWPIFFTAFLLLYFTPSLAPLHPCVASHLHHSFAHTLVVNAGFAAAVFYALFYIFLDFKAGSLAAALTVLCWVGSSVVGSAIGFSLAWKVVLAVQVFCWTVQMIGHAVFEKRKPAILHYHFQTLLLAPYFSVLQVLQKFCNYEPHAGFSSKVKEKMQVEEGDEHKAAEEKKTT